MENYWSKEGVWLFWEVVIAVAIIAFVVVRHFWIKGKKVTPTPDHCDPMNEESVFVENATYIFKSDKGVIVRNSEKVPHQFTLSKAKHYAKCFSDSEIQKYGDVIWYSCSTYFK